MTGSIRMAELYLWLKVGHIVSVVAWMAGLFYLPRLFVYHCRLGIDEPAYLMFCEMEKKLASVIMLPAALSTWGFGIALGWAGGYFTAAPAWFHVKLGLVILLSVYHWKLVQHGRQFAERRNVKSEGYFRVINEVPTILLVAIVIMVILRPFG